MMHDSSKWRDYWDRKSADNVSDYEFDRGADPRPADLEALSECEFQQFVQASPGDVLLDAGCGTGINILRLHRRVARIVAVDFSEQAVARCRRRVESMGIDNVQIHQSSVTRLPVEDRSVDRIICMSVFHYLVNDEVTLALREFARVLKPGGCLVLHVKNSASLYLTTLRAAKHAKKMLGREVTFEHIRPFDWYGRELQGAGFQLTDYNSFNLAIVEGMPRFLVHALQRMELTHRDSALLRMPALRRRGADLKLKARLA